MEKEEVKKKTNKEIISDLENQIKIHIQEKKNISDAWNEAQNEISLLKKEDTKCDCEKFYKKYNELKMVNEKLININEQRTNALNEMIMFSNSLIRDCENKLYFYKKLMEEIYKRIQSESKELEEENINAE